MLDQLISGGCIEPTVVVMPTWLGINNESAPSVQTIAKQYSTYLFPYIESTYHVYNDSSRRAFAGLSQGSILTREIYINYTSHFNYFGFFSGAQGSTAAPLNTYINSNQTAKNPALTNRSIYLSYGQYDAAFDDTKAFSQALDGLGISYAVRMCPFGYHIWNTWQDAFWHFGKVSLWKGVPSTNQTGHGL
ncbi:hypothetical protein JCM24511_07652 [Saitozyma sp. JCM 24511]|nr:hypothetical protein JCM24511_07652 [Saitozyma sp. JCM 24511]